MKRSAMLALIMGLGAAVPAGASEDTYRDTMLSREYHRCLGANPSNADMGNCLEYESERQEGRLNQAYRMVMARLPAPRRAALLSSERAWVKSRKRACDEAYHEMEGGTGAGIAQLMCLSVRAAKRTAWLEKYR